MVTRTLERCSCTMGVLLALTIAANAIDTAPAGSRPAAKATDSQLAGRAQPSEAPNVFHGVGFVTAIQPAGSLTINHQTIDGLMPAMEMMFSVNPRALTKGVRPGDQVEFNVEGKTFVIVGLKVIGHMQ
jgi:Cu/Ag efflux protein CusF